MTSIFKTIYLQEIQECTSLKFMTSISDGPPGVAICYALLKWKYVRYYPLYNQPIQSYPPQVGTDMIKVLPG